MTDQLAALDRQIRAAWVDLQCARRLWSRSPNADSIRHEELCEHRVNRLLERRYAVQVAEQVVTA